MKKKDKLLEVFTGTVFEVTDMTFWVDVEDRSGQRSHMEIEKGKIPEKYQERIFEGNYFTFIITEQRHKMNVRRIKYWTQEEIDEAKRLAEEWSKTLQWE